MLATPHVHVFHYDHAAARNIGGSSNYFVGDPKEGMVLIDVGDHEREWTRQLLEFYRDLRRPHITAILITHGHGDHFGGLDRVYDVVQAPVRCHPKLVKRLQQLVPEEMVIPLRSREVVTTGGGVTLRALFTPGHEEDHICYHFKGDRVFFTGDTILGASSARVSDLTSYMKSLELLTHFKHDTICPAHGPVVPAPRGSRLVRWYINHRQEREQQVVAALSKGLADPVAIAHDIYPRNLQRSLRRAAEGNVLTHLEKLVEEGRVARTSARYELVV